MSIFNNIKNKFIVIQDGRYAVRVEGYTYEKTQNNVMPIRWELKLMEDIKGVLPTKFSHVETDAGFEILMNELVQIGFLRPVSPEELESTLNSLIGKLVEVEIQTDGDYRNIRFIRKLY